MSAFDKVIGYQSIKEELLQICDLFEIQDAYRQLGAEIPHRGHPVRSTRHGKELDGRMPD